jgi:hypothetical protein
VKTGATRLAFDLATFGAHSLRSGLVTTTVKRGVNLLKICDQTRHPNGLSTCSETARGGHAGLPSFARTNSIRITVWIGFSLSPV